MAKSSCAVPGLANCVWPERRVVARMEAEPSSMKCLRFAQTAGDAEGVVLKGQLQVGDEVALGDSPEAVAVMFVRGGANGDRHQTPGGIDDLQRIDHGQADTGRVDNERGFSRRGEKRPMRLTCSEIAV